MDDRQKISAHTLVVGGARTKINILRLFILSFILAGSCVHAAGTASNTSITNRATLTATVSSVAVTVESSPAGNSTTGAGNGADTIFVVDNKVNVLVTEGNTTFTSVTSGETAAVTTFTVVNQGNTVQDFALTVANLANGTVLFSGTDNFDATGCAAYREGGANAGYQTAQDTATFLDELLADGTATVHVVCDIPAAQASNSNAVVSLTATARAGGGAAVLGGALTQTAGANTAGVDIVFGDSGGSDDAARDAAHSARDAYRVQGPTLSIVKTITSVLDTRGGSIVETGSVIRYRITVTLTGTGSVNNLIITDPLPAQTTYVAGSMLVNNAARTDAADGDNANFSANTITVNFGNTTSPVVHVIDFRATIN